MTSDAQQPAIRGRRARTLLSALLATALLAVLGWVHLSLDDSPPVQAAIGAVTAGKVRPSIRPRIVALGDSVPAGTACDCDSFADLLGAKASSVTGRHASVANFAQSGLTTAGLLDQLADDDSDVASRLRAATLVTVTVGANDFNGDQAETADCGGASNTDCFGADLGTLPHQLQAALSRIRSLTGVKARILVTGYWNVFLDGQVGAERGATYVGTSDALTRQVNSTIADAAAHSAGTYVDLYSAFKAAGDDDTPLLEPDGDHPNARGHQVIAKTLAKQAGLA